MTVSFCTHIYAKIFSKEIEEKYIVQISYDCSAKLD